MKNGGLITKTINTPTTSSASGVWSLQEQYEAETNDAWPKFVDISSISTDVLLYSPFDDSNNNTTARAYVKGTGLVSNAWSAQGNAIISTGQTNISGTSTSGYNPAGQKADGWKLDGTISTGLEVGSASPLSIEFWFYNSNALSGSYARLVSWGGYHVSGTGIEFETSSGNAASVRFYEFTGSGGNRRSIGHNKSITANAWNHIYWAFQPSGDSYLGINGVVTSTSGAYINNFAPVVDLHLLKTANDSDDSMKGYIQEVIVRNTVPYTANFTPSTTSLATI
jgi:hypothetical protein